MTEALRIIAMAIMPAIFMVFMAWFLIGQTQQKWIEEERTCTVLRFGLFSSETTEKMQ